MKYFFTLFFLLYLNFGFSQNVILDKETNERIPYVNIVIKNSSNGFYANKKGEFSIKKFMKKGDTLLFSSLGYNNKQIIYNDIKSLSSVVLTKKTETLDEVFIYNFKDYKIENLGVTTKKFGTFILSSLKLAVLIKNDSTKRYEGIIKELIFKKLKVKMKFREYTFSELKNKNPKGIKTKVNNDLALKLQLYKVNENTKLPDINSPLLSKDIFVRLDKNKTLKYDISSFNITMPKEVFLTLEVLGIYNDMGEIVDPEGDNMFSYGISTIKSDNNKMTYVQLKNKAWSKDRRYNAMFSLKVEYPIK